MPPHVLREPGYARPFQRTQQLSNAHRTVDPGIDEPTTTRLGVIYECPDCETRYLDERRCPDCNLFCRRIHTGGHRPYCDESVAISDLAEPTTPTTPQAVIMTT